MQNHNTVWAVYIIVAVLTLLCKCARYVYWGNKARKLPLDSIEGSNLSRLQKFWRTVDFSLAMLGEWFFDKTKENAVSWIATVFVVWTLGYLFIERTPGFLAPYVGPIFNILPVAVPAAGLLGWAAEMAAPNFGKWLVNKISSPVGG